eukprot:TRINITY_DN22566_c0_g1_i1.p1 TRINITY_DN22566_c0_g1~~TRINITY_DN22566_c0_g1_i1.p1  ORF type:complete len:142 (-),score=33.35 TRINITY_DN22566_c0_g1_i1:83-508(-)
MAHLTKPASYLTCDSDVGSNIENMTRRKVQRSGSFSEVEGDMKAGRLAVTLPKRSHSFRSCLKKPSTVEAPPFQSSSRHSSGSKAVMFTDEIGECLVEVKKYVETEPLKIIDNDNIELLNSKHTEETSTSTMLKMFIILML